MWDPTKNRKPHKAALLAMYYYKEAFLLSTFSAMQFWDSLDRERQRSCVVMVANIEAAPTSPQYNAVRRAND